MKTIIKKLLFLLHLPYYKFKKNTAQLQKSVDDLTHHPTQIIPPNDTYFVMKCVPLDHGKED